MLTLRPIKKRDTAELYCLVADPAVGIPANFRHPFHPIDAVEYVNDRMAAFDEGIAFTFAITRLGKLVGCCSLHTICWTTRSAEIGFWIGRPYWGQGFANTSVRQLLALAFTDIRLVLLTARCLARNQKAESLLLKNGFDFVESKLHKSPKWSRSKPIRIFKLKWENWAEEP